MASDRDFNAQRREEKEDTLQAVQAEERRRECRNCGAGNMATAPPDGDSLGSVPEHAQHKQKTAPVTGLSFDHLFVQPITLFITLTMHSKRRRS
jgi:hypothetical protein